MSNNDLVPEQRADRNGNIVTRWVKRTFAPKPKRQAIPQVQLPSFKQRFVDHMEAEALNDKLTKGLPKEFGAIEYDSSTSFDEIAQKSLQRHADVRKRALLTRAYENNDLEKLQLLDKYMQQYDPHMVSGTIDRLRKEGLGNVERWMTPERLNTVTDFFDDIDEADRMHQGEDPRYDSDFAKETEKLARHVTMHLEDGPALGTILKRGVRDARTAMELLKEFKSDGIPDTLNDGLL